MRHDRVGFGRLLWAGVRRSGWQSAVGLLTAAVAAGAIFSAAGLLIGMERLLGAGLQRLGADLLVVPAGSGEAVRQFLRTGTSGPLPAVIPVPEWRERVVQGKVLGVKGMEGWFLAEGGAGSPTGTYASIFLIRLERWISPLMAIGEVRAALPEADVVAAEQTTRNVARDMQPLVRLLTLGAGAALLAAILMNVLVASIRTAERGQELGMLRALGATRGALIALVLGESTALSLTGGLGGIGVAAVMLTGIDSTLAQALSPAEWAGLGTLALAVTGAAVCLASLGPALVVASRDPMEAARRS